MPIVSIRHRTAYRYRNPVAFGEHRVMYRPQEAFDQRILSATLDIGPAPSSLAHVEDASGAAVAVVRFDARADHLVFESGVELAHDPQAPFALEGDAAALGNHPFAYDADDAADLAPAAARQFVDEGEVEAWSRRFVRPVGRTRLSTLLSDMTHDIRSRFDYSVRPDGAPQSPLETLSRRGGSCRDFAVLMAEAARSLGLAARFTSGYVYSGSPKAERTGGGHTHAWVRIYLPGCGWTDFDPTNGIVGGQDLIRVAAVINPRAATPLHGSWSGLRGDCLGMDVSVDVVVQLKAQPRVPLRVGHGS